MFTTMTSDLIFSCKKRWQYKIVIAQEIPRWFPRAGCHGKRREAEAFGGIRSQGDMVASIHSKLAGDESVLKSPVLMSTATYVQHYYMNKRAVASVISSKRLWSLARW
jgi:hypothetical protein